MGEAMPRWLGATGLACLWLFGAGQPAAAADADVLRQFGMLGRLAVDCSAPYGKSNPHLIFAVGADGKITRTLRMTPDLDATLTMRNLRMVGPNVMQYDETGRQSELTISIAKQSDGRFRSWSSVRTSGPKTGEVLFKDGKTSEGSDTLAFTFCGP
jgi:hypothetical protein